MAKSTREDALREIKDTFGLVPEWLRQVPATALPGLWGQMSEFYLAETKVPNKYKELIGIAVSGATRCRYCAVFHTELARVHGATDDEIAEASMMGAMSMNASTFVNAQQIDYEQFRRETLQAVEYVKSKMAKSGKQASREQRPHA